MKINTDATKWLVIWHPGGGEQDWFVLKTDKTDKVYPSNAVVESADAYIQQEHGFGCPYSGDTEYFIDAIFNLAELKKNDDYTINRLGVA